MTTLFSSTVVPTVAPSVPTTTTTPKKKYGILPILTVLFLVSYGLMTMLIVEQGTTIESQRALIRELFRDSRELAAVKTKTLPGNKSAAVPQGMAQAPSHQGQATTHTPSTQAPVTQSVPSPQTPSVQTPSTQTPSTQAKTQHSAQNKPEKVQKFELPSKPAPELVDDRRALITI